MKRMEKGQTRSRRASHGHVQRGKVNGWAIREGRYGQVFQCRSAVVAICSFELSGLGR